MILTILHYIAGPVIGAVIGAFTNFIAIKMLFRPLTEKRIGKFRIPLTPGVIPKHQEELAESLSRTVYQNFFTNSDIEGIFMSEEMEDAFVEKIYQTLSSIELKSISDSLDDEAKRQIKESVYNKIHQLIVDSNIEDVVAEQANQIIQSKTQSGIAARILNESITGEFSRLIGIEVANYIKEHDMEILRPILEQQRDAIKDADAGTLLTEIGADKEKICMILKSAYRNFMRNAKTTIAETFHIKEFIYQKIMELNPADMERLVNEAIKREMNYLVYLGGLLGFLIGIINCFI